MPRLKKLSHLKQNREDPEENQQSSFRSPGKLQESNKEEEKPTLLGRKMKYRERVKILKEFENRQKHQEPQNESQIQVNIPEQAKRVDMGTYLDKFTDDDAECSVDSQKAPTQLKKSRKAKKEKNEKKDKRQIKVANKFFTEYAYEEMDIVEKQVEVEQLLVQKRQSKNPEHLLMKVEKKAENYKNRLDFKNFGENIRFKQDMKEKLKSLEGCDEVNLVIEVPKVFTGKNSHADAALFIKNVRTQNQNSISHETSQEELDESSVPKDRKNFYEGLVKKMKMKKGETITESILKECFKKSRLDESDYLLELDINPCEESRHEGKIEQCKRTSSREEDIESQSISKPEERQNKEPQKVQEKEREPERKQQEGIPQDNLLIPQQENEKANTSKQTPQAQTERPKQTSQSSIPKVVKEKFIPQKKNQKKLRRMRIKDLIQEEAQDSDDGLPKKKGQNQEQQEQSDDDDELSSLIDNDITLCEQEQAFAHRKFVKDMVELEEMKFLQMQKKYLDQRMQEQERLRMRMEAAARRNRRNEEVEQERNSEHLHIKAPSEPSDSSISNAKNMEKLKQLQIDLGLVNPNPSQSTPNPPSQSQTVNKALSNLEELLRFEQSANFVKPSRNGLLNLGRMKAKKNTKK